MKILNYGLKYGLMSGALIAAMCAITVPMCLDGRMKFENSMLVGYSMMVLAFLAVFFGILSYRRNEGGGAITFGEGFKIGLVITLVTSAIYVIGWEIVYWNFIPDFGDKYAAKMLEHMKAKGASTADLAKTAQEMEIFKVRYKNIFFNVGMTFLEIFPVGLVMTLISAGILRKRPSNALPPPAVAVGSAT